MKGILLIQMDIILCLGITSEHQRNKESDYLTTVH